MKDVIGVIMAGGKGERLWPLTKIRAKPAVPFGGKYRIIDFVMNNFVNSEIGNIMVLTQARSQSLNDHISRFWISNPLRGQYIDIVPAQMKISDEWYKGTADAVFQNLDIIAHNNQFSVAAIFAGDHIFKMDIAQMYDFHKKKNAQFTISVLTVPVSGAAGNLGVVEVDNDFRVVGFEEKPEHPKEIPGKPGYCFVSMGNYLAEIIYLSEILKADAKKKDSSHDFGKDAIPFMLKRRGKVYAYDFSTNVIPGQEEIYWRDVGTIKAFWEANMDLRSVTPQLNLYDRSWPLRTFPDYTPPAKTILGGKLDDSLVSGRCIISGGTVKDSVLSQNVLVKQDAIITDSVIFSDVVIEEGARIRNAIVDKEVTVPPGMHIGFSKEEDLEKGLSVVDGITIVSKNFSFSGVAEKQKRKMVIVERTVAAYG
jgi:glucose-1-phosphate adenylyltransferase